jgi:hypothetical protein
MLLDDGALGMKRASPLAEFRESGRDDDDTVDCTENLLSVIDRLRSRSFDAAGGWGLRAAG